MPDVAVANAKAKRDEIAAEINRLQDAIASSRAELQRVDRFISEWHEFAAEPKQDENDTSPPESADENATPKRRPQNPPREIIGDRVEEIIRGRGKPVPRRDILSELIQRGIHLEGHSPIVVLSTMLWRMKDRFPHLKGHGYWLADMPYEPADYEGRAGASDLPLVASEERGSVVG